MHILYADESGTHDQAGTFVVAGLAVFEQETYWLAQHLDRLAEQYFPDLTERVEFHASHLHVAEGVSRPPFSMLDRQHRADLRDDIYRIIGESNARAFAAVIAKTAPNDELYAICFEQIVSRFDRMLQRIYHNRGERQRGLVVVAQSSYQQQIVERARSIWESGHRWGQLRNMADIPFFAPAKDTRLLQLADFVSNAVYRRYESGDTRQFDRIAQRFDEEDGRLHGLVHIAPDEERQRCFCPACVLWRAQRGAGRRRVEEAGASYPSGSDISSVQQGGQEG